MKRSEQKPRLSTRDLVACVALALVGVLTGSPVWAQAQGIVGFSPIGDYLVEIDGVDEESAQIFGAQHARALVILSSDLPSPVLIELGNGNVSGLHLMKVAKRANGSLDLLPDPVAGSHGVYNVSGDQIQFQVDGRQVVVKPKPVLVGNRRGEELVEYDASYGVKRDQYEVTPALVAQLRQQSDDVRVRIYFGTWCPFCTEMVPRVLRIADELDGSKVRFEYYGLPRRINEDAEARAMNISGVPTGIVYRDGREVGRISGNSWRTPEQAILEILETG
jgi:thiol-disulfide isomerase/thioredoxin